MAVNKSNTRKSNKKNQKFDFNKFLIGREKWGKEDIAGLIFFIILAIFFLWVYLKFIEVI